METTSLNEANYCQKYNYLTFGGVDSFHFYTGVSYYELVTIIYGYAPLTSTVAVCWYRGKSIIDPLFHTLYLN